MKLPVRFSLRTLAILLTLICFVLGVPIGYIRYKAERQRQAIARLKELNVSIGLQNDAKTSWVTHQLRRWVDKDAFRKVVNGSFRTDSSGIDESLDLLSELADLREISCNKAPLTDHHFAKISEIATLTHLSVEQGTCSPETLRKLLGNRNWEMLALPMVRFNDEALGELGKQKRLLRLTFDAADASAVGLESLSSCKALMELAVYRARTCGELARVMQSLPSINLIIFLQSSLSAEELAEFGNVGSLESLHFYECQIDSTKFDQLANSTSLKQLEFFKSPVSREAVFTIASLSKLQVLSLDSCLDDQNVVELAKLPALKILAFSRTALSDDGLQLLAKIRTLTLVVLPIDTKCTEAGIRRLQEKAAIRVVVGEHMSDGILYIPGGGTEDRRKPKKP